jgi:hypothetical protein
MFSENYTMKTKRINEETESMKKKEETNFQTLVHQVKLEHMLVIMMVIEI